MQRPLLIGALVAIALTGIGGGIWLLTRSEEPEVASPAADERPARRHARRGGRPGEASDPMHDVKDDSPVTPPDRLLALIRPHDPKLAQPDTTPVQAPKTPPNVVVLLGCTIRKDQLTPYGADSFITPRLDALAKSGTLFDDVIAAAPWTRAASTAILTGQHALEIGMVEPTSGRDDSRIPDGTKTLADYMRARGYLTIGATANPNLSAVFGFDHGFDAYQPGLPDKWGAKLAGRVLADAVLGELKAKRAAGDTRPVYLRTMMLDAHAPRSANGDALTPFREEGVPERVAQYRYHLHKLDDAIGYTLDQLATLGIDQSNTVFVFVGDHGEGMNYPGHHGFGHGQYFGSSSVYVPWIMSGVGVARNHRVLGLASQVDVLPTLLGVIGAPLAPTDPTDGQDLSRLVRGEPGVIERDHVISDTWFAAASRAAIFTPYLQCQQDFGSSERQQRKGKFVAGCYDRVDDALFASPLLDADPRRPQLDALTATLVDWRKVHTAALATLEHQSAPVSDDLAQQLGALGYVDAPEAGGEEPATRAKP
jgi:arylsulfatase A-like enzyme